MTWNDLIVKLKFEHGSNNIWELVEHYYTLLKTYSRSSESWHISHWRLSSIALGLLACDYITKDIYDELVSELNHLGICKYKL